LLNTRRDALRTYNAQHTLPWVEDPSNENRNYSRIRARDHLKDKPHLHRDFIETADQLKEGLELETSRFREFCDTHINIDLQGIISLSRVPPPRLLQHVVRAASGTGGPILQSSISNLQKAMGQTDFSAITLSGAMIINSAQGFQVGRDPVVGKGRHNQAALAPQRLEAGQSYIWDGRFQIKVHEAGLMIGPYAKCPHRDQTHNGPDIPSPFTGSCPTIWDENGDIKWVGATKSRSDVTIEALVASRLHMMV